MSDYEARRGKLKEITFRDGATFGDKILALQTLGYTIEYEDAEDYYLECENLMVVGERIFKILSDEKFDYSDFSSGSIGDDGVFEYMVVFYNGGCSLSEAVGEALECAENVS